MSSPNTTSTKETWIGFTIDLPAFSFKIAPFTLNIYCGNVYHYIKDNTPYMGKKVEHYEWNPVSIYYRGNGLTCKGCGGILLSNIRTQGIDTIINLKGNVEDVKLYLKYFGYIELLTEHMIGEISYFPPKSYRMIRIKDIDPKNYFYKDREFLINNLYYMDTYIEKNNGWSQADLLAIDGKASMGIDGFKWEYV